MKIQIHITLSLNPGADLSQQLGSGEIDVIDEAKEELQVLASKLAQCAIVGYSIADDVPLDSEAVVVEFKTGKIERS